MGITFDSKRQKFQFDFEHDGTSDLITLTGSGYQVEAFGKCFYYDYDLVIYPESSSQVNQYMLRYIYRFAQPTLRKYEDIQKLDTESGGALCTTIRNQNILVIDDITTSGSTLNEILRTLRILNQDNSITIFSLLGRKNLMAEMG